LYWFFDPEDGSNTFPELHGVITQKLRHVSRVEEKGNAYRILVGELEGKDN
jgi:hypothetical protein